MGPQAASVPGSRLLRSDPRLSATSWVTPGRALHLAVGGPTVAGVAGQCLVSVQPTILAPLLPHLWLLAAALQATEAWALPTCLQVGLCEGLL